MVGSPRGAEAGVVAAGLREAMTGMRLGEPGVFPVGEKVLLAAAIVASVGVFAWRLGPMARNVWGSKKDADFSLRPVGARVWKFFWEVLCQGKVIEQRPLPGLAHALVFWGFLAFALVTLNHMAVGFGVGFLQYAGGFGTFYVGFAAVWALLVAVSIAGLFVRRFVVRPRWLGAKVSVESGVIAGLIFALMVTYLAALFVEDRSGAAVGLWWAHTLVLLAFLPIIPGTKHLHLVLSPLTVFLKRPGFSQLPKLEGDEDFGLVAGKDLTQMIALQAYSCVECGRCTEHCPAATTGKVLNPKEIVLGVRSYLNAEGAGSEVALLDGEAGGVVDGGGVCVHDLWGLRVSVPGGGAASARADWAAAGCGEYRGVGGQVWDEAVSGAGEARELAGHELGGERQVYCEAGVSTLRWLAGVLPVAGVHGEL